MSRRTRAFHGVPCETGELWVTWWFGTQGPKGQGGYRHRKSAAWHRVAWGYQQSAAWPLGATALIERADVCFDSSFVSPRHVCLLVDVPLRPFSPEASLNQKRLVPLPLIADPAGHLGRKKKTDKNSPFCLCFPSFSLSPPRLPLSTPL